jgi:hypothetical protein
MTARKSKTVSRRSAVPKSAPPPSTAADSPGQPYDAPLETKNCVGHKTTSGFGNARDRKQLQLETCCIFLKDVLDHGYSNAKAEPRKLLKNFMSQLADEVKRDALMDYCYVQFDLTDKK